MKRVIVVGTYGWVFSGYADTEFGFDVSLERACVVRKWGTTKGLGQLALSGPTNETVLDECGTVRVPANSVVAVIECQGWE